LALHAEPGNVERRWLTAGRQRAGQQPHGAHPTDFSDGRAGVRARHLDALGIR
jgi:hypothetical protein